MDRYLKDQRVVLAIAGVGAALLALIFALLLGGRGKPSGPPPASQSGLQVSLAPAPALNAGRPLRCFVNGQMVGELTLAECAQRNGVAAQSLDVGRDENGALTAAPTASLAPVPVAPAPQQQAAAMAPPITTAAPAIDQGPPAACLHYVGSNWVTLSEGMTQGACLRALFGGKCVRPGEADYGHWGETTVRLIFPSQVQVAPDNRSFHTLYDQGRACEGPPVR